MRQLIDDGVLSDYDYYAPEEIDFAETHIRTGEFVQSEVLARVDKNQITGNAIEHYRRYADHVPAIVSCVSISHAEHVARQFQEAGYSAQAIHSKMPQETIEAGLNGLKTGAIDLLVQCELIGEGIDIPGAKCLIGLRPTASLTIFLQHCGRVLRRHNGQKAIILDHVSNWTRHGLPDDPRQWSLDGVDRDTSGRLDYKHCPGCLRPVPVRLPVCPHCGFQFETRTVTRELPQEKAGELVAVRRDITNDLILKIAREASTLKEAIAIAGREGFRHTTAWMIWTKYLYNT